MSAWGRLLCAVGIHRWPLRWVRIHDEVDFASGPAVGSAALCTRCDRMLIQVIDGRVR